MSTSRKTLDNPINSTTSSSRNFSTSISSVPLSSSPQEDHSFLRSKSSDTNYFSSPNVKDGKRTAQITSTIHSPTPTESRLRSASAPIPIAIHVSHIDQELGGRSKSNTMSSPLEIVVEDPDTSSVDYLDQNVLQHSPQTSSDSGYSTSASSCPQSSSSANMHFFTPSSSPVHNRFMFPTTPPSARSFYNENRSSILLSPSSPGMRKRDSVSSATSDSRQRQGSVTAADKLHLLTARMRSQVSQDWAGVNNMEVLRNYTKNDLRLQELLKRIADLESQFLSDQVGAEILTRLRNNIALSQSSDSTNTININSATLLKSGQASVSSSSSSSEIIPAARLDTFIDSVFAAHFRILDCHRSFLAAVQEASIRVAEQGNAIIAIAQLFLDHSQKLTGVFSEFGEELWLAQRIIVEESETNFSFRRFLQGRLSNGRAILTALEDYLQKPFEQIKLYPVVLKAALNNAPKEPGNSSLAEALRLTIQVIDKLVVDATLLVWQLTLGKDSRHQITWSDLMYGQPDIEPMEVERQTAIFEFIREEMLWVRNLALFNTLFVEPLQSASPAILSPDKLNYFLIAVCNVQVLFHQQHFNLLRSLQMIQREQCPVIKSLVKPSGMADLDWIQTYEVTYAANTNDAIAWIKEEISVNPAFDHFLSSATFHDESNGQNIEEWLVGPLLYITRSLKLLRRILDKTPEGNQDATDIPPLIKKLERVYNACKVIWPNSEGHEALSELAPLFVWTTNGADLDVDVEHPSRHLLYDGRIWLSSEGRDVDVHVFILDNFLLVTDPIKRKGILRFEVKRSPIPLELLEIAEYSQERHATRVALTTSGTHSVATPITLRRKDGDGEINFLLNTVAQANEWKERLAHAFRRRMDLVEEKYQSFQLKNIHRGFAEASCSFAVPSEEAITLLAYSAPDPGIWVIRPRTTPVLVLPVQNVTQMGVINELLVVLASKTVTVYRLSDILEGPPVPFSQIIQLNETVFFRVHQSDQFDTLILLRKHKNRNIFELYRMSSVTSRPLVKLSKKMHLLDKIIQFDFPVPCHDILFMKSRTVMLTSDGFRFVDLDIAATNGSNASISRVKHLQGTTLPFPTDPWKELVNKCKGSRPLTILKSSTSTDILLCFDRIGVFIDEKGKLTGKSIEWISKKVQHIVSFAPYLVVVGRRVVEVRHATTGKLRQIMGQPSELQITWDGRDAWRGKISSAVQRIHVVSNRQNQQQYLQELIYHPQSFIL